MGKLDSHKPESEKRPLSYLIQKINSKWIKELNVRPETIKFVEENARGKFCDAGLDNVVLDLTPKVKVTKAKIKQMGLHQTKKHLYSNTNHQPSTKWKGNLWENIFANQLPGELLIYKYIKNSHKSKKAQTTRSKNGQRIWIEIFSNEDIQMANRYRGIHLSEEYKSTPLWDTTSQPLEQAKLKGWIKYMHTNTNHKKAEVTLI